MFFAYVLRSKKNGRLYTGSTDNVQRRLEEHNSGHSKATRYIRPFELLHAEQFATRADAVQRERELKTGKGRDELRRLLHERDLVGP